MNIPELHPKITDVAAHSMPHAIAITAAGALAPFLGLFVFIPSIARAGAGGLAAALTLLAITIAGLATIRAAVPAAADSPLATFPIPERVIHAGAATLLLGLALTPFTRTAGATLAILGLAATGGPLGLWAANELPAHRQANGTWKPQPHDGEPHDGAR